MSIKKRIISAFTAAGLLLTGMPIAAFSPYTAVVSADDSNRGDISGNGKIDLYDAIMIAESLVGKRKFTEEDIKIADFNGDGRVDLYDAIGIANYILTGKLPVIPEVTLSDVKWVGGEVRFDISYKNIDEAKIFIVPANTVRKNDDVQTVFMNFKSVSAFQSGNEGRLGTADFAAGDYELRVYERGKMLCCEQFTIDGKQETLFSTFNKLTVENKPKNEVTFTPEKDCRVYSISTYHWNYGKGMNSAGSIEVLDNGQSFGKLPTLGSAGQNGAANVNWTGYPAIVPAGDQSDVSGKFTGFVMKAGHTYTIIDSDPDTWSCNTGSNYKGFTEIKGNYIDDSAEPAVTTAITEASEPPVITAATTAVTAEPTETNTTTAVPVTSAAVTSSTAVTTSVSGTGGTAFVFKDGNSAAFKTEMRKGLTVSAEENAFEYDGQLKISEVDDKTAAEINEECYEAGYAMIDCWDVDAGLKPEEYLPGSYHCEYDLSKSGIPEDMYDQVQIIRLDDNGGAEIYPCELNGNILSWNSSKNSVTIAAASIYVAKIAAGVVIGGYLVQGAVDYKDTILKSGVIRSDHFVFYYNAPENSGSENYEEEMEKIEKEAWDKALKETKENMEMPDDANSYLSNAAQNALINIQALKLKAGYLKDNKDYQTMKKNKTIPPDDIKKIRDYCEDAYDYLTTELKAQAPDRMIPIVCMDHDKMDEWGLKINPGTNLQYSGTTILKVKTRNPYIQIRRPKTADGMSDADANNNMILTATHELFHLFTNDHYPGNDLNCLEFAEMTAMWTESKCIDYYLKNGTLINEKNENGVIFGKGEYEANSSQQYMLKNGINYRYEYKADVQNKGYALSRFAAFLEKNTETKNMNPWTMSLLYNKKYQKSGSVTDLLKEAFGLTDKELENAWTKYAQSDYESIINATDKYPKEKFVFKKGGDTKQTYDVTPADYSINGYSVECDRNTYINKKWAFMVRSDVEGNYGNLFNDLPKKTQKYILKFDKYNTKKGIVMAQTNPMPSGGQFAEYQGVGVPKGGKFSVYIFMQPDAPKVEYNESTQNIIVTLPENIRTAAAEDGIIDGYKINLYVNDSKDPISKILTLENAVNPYEISVSELNIEAGKKSDISVDIQEYIGKAEGYQEFAGPASEKAGTNTSAKPDEVKEDAYVWVLTDTEVDAGEKSSELKHYYHGVRTYNDIDEYGWTVSKEVEFSAEINCEKAPPPVINMGEQVTLDLSIKMSLPDNFPSDKLYDFVTGSADFDVRWNGYDYDSTESDSIQSGLFDDRPLYMGDTKFYSTDSSGQEWSEVIWSTKNDNYLSGKFVCEPFSSAGDYRYINFTSSAGTTRWKYEKRIAKEYEWKLSQTIDEPTKNYSDDQNTYDYTITEITENDVKKSVHVFSAKNSAEGLKDETAVFTAKCLVPDQTYKTLDDIKLDMTMSLESNAEILTWDDTSKVYMQKITDDSAPVYFRSSTANGSSYCYCKTVNLDGSTPEQINSASVYGSVSAAYEEGDKWEVVFESKAGKTRWIYECEGVVDNHK